MSKRAVTAAGAALALALAATGCSGSSHRRPASAALTPTSSTTSTSLSPTSTAGPTTTAVPASLAATGAPVPPPPDRGATPAVAPGGSVALGVRPTRIVLAWPEAFVLGEATAGHFDVARVDLPTLAVGARVTLAGTPVGAGVSTGGLYVVAGGAGGATSTLSRLDPTSLAVQTQVALAGRGSQVVARTDGIYVAPGTTLERRDPVTLAARASLPMPAHDDAPDLAADPRATTLWVVLPATDPPLTLVEVDLGAFRVLRSRRDLGGVRGGSVSAVLDGVWVGFPTGTQSTAVKIRATDGTTVATFQGAMPNSAAYTVSGSRLWFSGGRAAGLGCADVTTGAVAGTSQVAPEASPFVADTHVAVLGDPAGAVRLLVPTDACR